METTSQRLDHKVIIDWVASKARVLDLGCVDGVLLSQLI